MKKNSKIKKLTIQEQKFLKLLRLMASPTRKCSLTSLYTEKDAQGTDYIELALRLHDAGAIKFNRKTCKVEILK